MAKNACCCFTGHRPDKLPWGRSASAACTRFKKALEDAVENQYTKGCTCFYTGMAEGFDLWAAEAVLQLKLAHPHVRLIAVRPFEGQELSFSAQNRALYRLILGQADEVITLSGEYTRGCYHMRNRYMVDHSAHLIAGYASGTAGGSRYTLEYARRRGLDITMLDPYAFL